MIDDRLAAYGAPEWIWKLCSVLTWYGNIRRLYVCDSACIVVCLVEYQSVGINLHV